MKEELQKTRNDSCLLNDRLEAESIEGAQTIKALSDKMLKASESMEC